MNQWNNINWQSADYRAKDLKGVSTGQQIGNVINSTASGAATGAKIGGPWGAVAGAIAGAGTSIGGIFAGKGKAKRLADSLNAMATLANSDNIEQYNMAMMMANNNIYDNLYGNFAAYGGNLNMDIPNYQTHGGDFFNGVTKINEGGTHEENPNGGIIMGIDEKGVPNLVEEGEVIYNDYVYSNRLTPDDKMLEKFNFPSKYKGRVSNINSLAHSPILLNNELELSSSEIAMVFLAYILPASILSIISINVTPVILSPFLIAY